MTPDPTPKDHAEAEEQGSCKSQRRLDDLIKDYGTNINSDVHCGMVMAWNRQDAHYQLEVERLTKKNEELKAWSNEHRKQRDDLQEENNRQDKLINELCVKLEASKKESDAVSKRWLTTIDELAKSKQVIEAHNQFLAGVKGLYRSFHRDIPSEDINREVVYLECQLSKLSPPNPLEPV